MMAFLTHPNGAGIPQRLLHPPIWSLMLMPMVETPLQESLLGQRNVQLQELMMTHMMGRQCKVLIIQIVKCLLWMMGVAPCIEQCCHGVWHIYICMSRLYGSANHQQSIRKGIFTVLCSSLKIKGVSSL